MLWKHKVEPVILGHRLHLFLVSPSIPGKFLFEADRKFLVSSSITGKFPFERLTEKMKLPTRIFVLGEARCFSSTMAAINDYNFGSHKDDCCKHSYQLWDRIHAHFHAKTKVKARQLLPMLRNMVTKVMDSGNST